MNLQEATMRALQGKLDEAKSTGKLFTCIEDRQGGDFAVGYTMTAEEWGETAYGWAYGDDWTDPEEPLLKNFNTEEECIDFIQDMWELTIVPSDSPEAKEFLGEARSHKEDNERVAPRDLPTDYIDVFDSDEEKAYYGRGLTKRDKIRSEDQAKRNAERDDDRQTGKNINISGSYEKTVCNPDVENYKFRKDMARIHRGEEPTYNKDLTVNDKSKLEPTRANLKMAKDWDKLAQEIVDKHKKSEAKLVEDEYTDNLKSAIGDANTLDDVKEWVDDIERRVEELETAYNTMYADILDAVDDLFSDNTPRGCLTGLSNAIRDVKEELNNIKFD